MPSSYFSKLRSAVQNGFRKSTGGNDSGFYGSVELLVGKWWFRSQRSFHPLPYSWVPDLNVLSSPSGENCGRSDLQSGGRRRNISVVGAFYRTISTPSVSGPVFQVCSYHIDRALSEPDKVVGTCTVLNNSMAACNYGAATSDCCGARRLPKNMHRPVSVNHAAMFSTNRSFHCCQRASMGLKNKEQPSNYQIYGYFMLNSFKQKSMFGLDIESGLRDIYVSTSRCFSAGIAPDVSFDNCSRDEQLPSSSSSYAEKSVPGKALRLLSGSCYLPHPDKEETGGEDAHFICADEQAVGVADGVGGWAEIGIDAGLYSRELMSNSIMAVQEEPKGSVDPFRVLEKAYFSTKAKGSSTACIISLTDQGLHAINLGDSGFMVVRDGCTVFRSPVQQHGFNITYQLESGNTGDLPSSGQVFTIPVAPGDVVIAGTDGLFDNLYNNEITAVVVHATRAGLGPQVTAQKIAALARQRAQDKDRQTPFSTAAQDAGIRYYGGKLDDITVVVSYITGSNDEKRSAA
ncbi:hypothetical protein MLD38_024766 [Melastoma candidum]|uniref:Uncharacterized protein n=1 Tax=Melastoma candidum TaxID=119954 RepID=A0ACB9P048_9MYRT|nr:hypothetical protein MLD38_024766 [Melastoma candidum]